MKKIYQIDLKGDGDWTDTTKKDYEDFPGYKRIVGSEGNEIDKPVELDAAYWKQRCEAAEACLNSVSGRDTTLPLELVYKWQSLKQKQ